MRSGAALRKILACTTAASLLAWDVAPVLAGNAAETSFSLASVAGEVSGLQTVGVLPLVLAPELPASDRAALQEALHLGLERGEFQISDLKLPAGATSCTGDCLRQLASRNGLTYLITARVELKDRDYLLDLALVNARAGEVIASSKVNCEICGLAEVSTLLSNTAGTLRAKLEALRKHPAEITIESSPPGAVVEIDGSSRGTTPLKMELVPGKHEMVVQKEGYEQLQRELMIVEGVRENSSFVLQPSVRGGRRLRTGAVIGVVAGGLLLAGGGFFLAIHGKPDRRDCSAENMTQDAKGNCRYLWDTMWPGVAMAGVGFGLVGSSITVFYLQPRKNTTATTARVEAGPGILRAVF